MSKSTTNKLLSLESLRGFAAISVAFYHFRVNSHFNNEFFLNAWLMVDFFFVLSGFVIALNYQNKIINFDHLKNFQYKRFLRLYPLHIIMLMAYLFLEFLKYLVELNYGIVGTTSAFSLNNSYSFILNFFLLQNWVLYDLTYNLPSWSISAEFYTYAIFGLIVLVFKQSSFKIVITSFVLIMMTGLLLSKIGMGTNNLAGPARCIFSFFIGVLTYNFYKRYNLHSRIESSFFSAVMLMITVVLVSSFGKDKYGIVVLMPFIFAITLLSVVATKNSAILIKALSNSKLVYLGTISYGIYMIHFFIWYILRQIFMLIFNIDDYVDAEGMTYLVFNNQYLADFLALSGIALIILLSHLSYQFVEKRFYMKNINRKP